MNRGLHTGTHSQCVFYIRGDRNPLITYHLRDSPVVSGPDCTGSEGELPLSACTQRSICKRKDGVEGSVESQVIGDVLNAWVHY
jgi:hypothetical protein